MYGPTVEQVSAANKRMKKKKLLSGYVSVPRPQSEDKPPKVKQVLSTKQEDFLRFWSSDAGTGPANLVPDNEANASCLNLDEKHLKDEAESEAEYVMVDN